MFSSSNVGSRFLPFDPVNLMKAQTTVRPFCIECPKGSGCHCGESPDAIFEWQFSAEDKTSSAFIIPDERKIYFHPDYSVGTAACRGTTILAAQRHHFWELRMTSPVYGTDVMVGIATKDANINYEGDFVSALGIDNKSWGFSYQGTLHHGGAKPKMYAQQKWSEGSIVGIHLDRWRGTIEFYLNRKPLGVAFRDIPSHLEVYPVISSTAAKSSMRLICAQSYPCDLAFECVRVLSRARFSESFGNLFSSFLKSNKSSILGKTKTLYESFPPGLAKFVDNNCWYLLGTRMNNGELSKTIQPFRDNSKDRKLRMVEVTSSSDDEETTTEYGTKRIRSRSTRNSVKQGKRSVKDIERKDSESENSDSSGFLTFTSEETESKVDETSPIKYTPVHLRRPSDPSQSVSTTNKSATSKAATGRKRFVLSKKH